MTASRTIDRKTFLSSSAATLASLALGCSEEASGGTSAGSTMGSTSSGGTGMGTTTGGDSTAATNTVATNTSASTSVGGTGTTSSSTTGDGGTTSASTSVGGTSTNGNGGMGGASTSDGGTGNTTIGGTGGTGGTSYSCGTETDNGDHSHPLTIPGEDVAFGYAADPYVLEDGGTGHTHLVALSAYDFFYLQGGYPITLESTEESGHTHMCEITCTSE